MQLQGASFTASLLFLPIKSVFSGTKENRNILQHITRASNASTLWKLLIWYRHYVCNIKLLSTVILHSKWNLYCCNKMYFNSNTTTLSYYLTVFTVKKSKIQPGKHSWCVHYTTILGHNIICELLYALFYIYEHLQILFVFVRERDVKK